MQMILYALGEKEKGVVPTLLPSDALPALNALSFMLVVVCEVLVENED
jgi:hypothetical protein